MSGLPTHGVVILLCAGLGVSAAHREEWTQGFHGYRSQKRSIARCEFNSSKMMPLCRPFFRTKFGSLSLIVGSSGAWAPVFEAAYLPQQFAGHA